MEASEQACTLIRGESAECCLQLLCFSFQADPAQFPNEFDNFAGCFLLRRLIRNSVCKLNSFHDHPPACRFCCICSRSRVVTSVRLSELVRRGTILSAWQQP